MKILLATEVIVPGGAETFVLRLSRALERRGHKVVLFTFYKDNYHAGLPKLIAPDVELRFPPMPMEWVTKKADSLLFRMNIDKSARNVFVKKELRKVLEEMKADVIHSHLLKVDRICLEVGGELNIPVVTTIHGDYLQFYNKEKQGIPVPIRNYYKKAKNNLEHLGKVVCISDKQVDFFKTVFPNETKGKIEKIYNGYDGAKPAVQKKSLRDSVGLKEGDFVFGMVSRGIKEKGWEESIKAVQQLANPNVHLLFIGDGDYLKALAEQYHAEKQVHFIGHSDEPLEWINVFDVGLLPSTYASESLPTVVIEYLCCNKPVIASDAGEIKNMIQKNGNAAGTIVPIQDNKVSVDGVAAAMKQYIEDKEYYGLHKKNTAVCYEQFDMDECIASYTRAYTEALNNKK